MRALLSLALVVCAACQTTPMSHVPRQVRPDVRFSGNETYSSSRLLSALASELNVLPTTGANKASADDMAYEIERFYLRKGFMDVETTYEFSQPAGAAAVILIHVDERARTLVAGVALEGVEAFKHSDVRAFFDKRRAGLFGDGPLYYVEEYMREAVNLLRDYYYASGYQEAEVLEPTVSFSEDRSVANVKVQVTEGPRRVLRGVLPAANERLQAAARTALGMPFTPRVGHAIRSRLLEAYGRAGFPDCEARIVTHGQPDGSVELEFDVTPGDLVRIVDIVVTGNEHTSISFIELRVGIERGSAFDSERIRKAFARLYESGLFKRVQVELLDGQGPERILQVVVEEASTVELYAEPGYGSYERARITLGGSDRNIFGGGRTLRAESTLSELAQSARISLDDPWFFNSELKAHSSIFWTDREEPSYTLNELGTNLGVTRNWSPTISTSVTYEYRQTALTDVDVNAPPASGIVTDADISSIKFSIQRDSRDSFLLTTSGALIRLSTEVADSALGSELEFLRVTLSATNFRQVATGRVLAASVRTGVITPSGDTINIPLQERFFNGGENTVRSFREDQLGPMDINGDPVGGEAYTVVSAELRQQIVGSLAGAVFADAGNTVFDHSNYFDFADFRTGIGVGLRYMLPIGPLRLDGAINPDAKPGEDDYVIHLSVGMAF